MRKSINFWIGSGMICLFIANAIFLFTGIASDHLWLIVIAVLMSVLQIFLFKSKLQNKPGAMVSLSRPLLK